MAHHGACRPKIKTGRVRKRRGWQARSGAPSGRPTHPCLNTARWRRLRLQVIARDGYTCQRCGVVLTHGRSGDRSAVVHHLVSPYERIDLAFDPGNLAAVCRRCHYADIQRQERDPHAAWMLDPDGDAGGDGKK